MNSTDDLKDCLKDRVQHYILNWIVISRYQMVHHGVSKNITQRYLGLLENILKRINIINS